MPGAFKVLFKRQGVAGKRRVGGGGGTQRRSGLSDVLFSKAIILRYWVFFTRLGKHATAVMRQ